MEMHGLDTETAVYFYEQDFYVLSNFSAFSIRWQGRRFPTSEHAYHWEKFEPGTKEEHGFYVRDQILMAESAHDAFKMAEAWKPLRRPKWDSVKVDTMRDILRQKARQHEYVRRKLLATGDRTLIENSWRDDFWGWGPNRDGQNMLGRLWMEVRAELRGQGLQGDRQVSRALAPHQARVVDEKTELDTKWQALRKFIGESLFFETLNPAEQARMRDQLDAMRRYSEILGWRIAAFELGKP